MTDMSKRPTREEREAADAATQEKRGPGRPPKQRRERVPLSAMRQKLQAPKREGFTRRWVNDEGGRPQDFERAGYAFVEDEGVHTDGEGSRISRRVGKTDEGRPIYAFLMEQKQEWYDEDQAEKNKELDATDQAIKSGNIAGQVGQDGRYTPSQGITYKRD
jgi:hypothetical protein